MQESLDRKNMIAMKLLHYFITVKNYNPIILQGAEDEIWLENLNSDYKIIRIVSSHIHNEEQLDFDIFKTKHVVKKIRKKTFSFKMNVISIFTDLENNVDLENANGITCVSLYDEKDIVKNEQLNDCFPDLKNKVDFTEEGFQLFMKITADINRKNKEDANKVDEVFKPKRPIVTYILIAINIIIFAFMFLSKDLYNILINHYSNYGPYIVKYGEFYRLFTGAFLHGNIFHLLFNVYALYVVGSQIESFMGKSRYIIIYFFSILIASLFSAILSGYASVGASGAIFGLLGALLYFGYHYRVYLGGVLKSQIIPLILINLVIGFMGSNIDNFAHIGGLIGGLIITSAIGVKYKSSNFEKINGTIVALLLVGILLFALFNLTKFS